jgi:ATP-dependent RNA helicase DHX37/DHR1
LLLLQCVGKDESRLSTYVTRRVDGSVSGTPVAPTVVHVVRPKDVENGRRDLPIIMMEQEIMETINNHSSVIISGETGCGKTTQIPQVGCIKPTFRHLWWHLLLLLIPLFFRL